MVIALSLLFVLALTASAWANPACAVCTVAVGASLEIARQLGVDDSVVGVWAGAMLAIIGFWTIRWFEKKGWNFKGRDWTLIIVSVAMIGFMYISEIKYTQNGFFFTAAGYRHLLSGSFPVQHRPWSFGHGLVV